MSSERSETMIDIRVGCYFVPLQSNERSDYTRKMFMHVPLNERRLKCLPQKLRCHSQTYNLENVLRHKRGFTGANLWYKYYLCVKGGSLLTSVLHRARFNDKLAKLSIIQCNAQPMMQIMRRGTPFFITLQQETENVPASAWSIALWGFYNISREQAMGRQGCGLINDWNGYITAYLLPSTQLDSG